MVGVDVEKRRERQGEEKKSKRSRMKEITRLVRKKRNGKEEGGKK